MKNIKLYVELAKPRILSMILVTTTLGFFLGGRGVHQDLRVGAGKNPARARRTPLHAWAGADSVLHVYVPSWRGSAHLGQHVVPLDFWRQCGGAARLARIFALLSCLRHFLRLDPDCIFLGLTPAGNRSERGNFRHTRCVHCLLPFFSHPDSYPTVHNLVHLANSSDGFYWLVVFGAIHKRHRLVERSSRCGVGRSRLVGSRRRVSYWHAVSPHHQAS